MSRERKCVYCGCTDSRACAGGCSWIIVHPATNTGVCSNESCMGKMLLDVLGLRNAELAPRGFEKATCRTAPSQPSPTSRPSREIKRSKSKLP